MFQNLENILGEIGEYSQPPKQPAAWGILLALIISARHDVRRRIILNVNCIEVARGGVIVYCMLASIAVTKLGSASQVMCTTNFRGVNAVRFQVKRAARHVLIEKGTDVGKGMVAREFPFGDCIL